MNLIKLTEPNFIRDLLKRDNLYLTILGNIDINSWEPDLKTTSWFTHYFNNDPIGIIFFRDFAPNILAYHGGLFKEYRGKNSIQILSDCLEFVRKQVNCKFITTVSLNNRAALALDKKLNFKELATINDIVILGE